MILQMVADKKITASEAAELLKALDAPREAAAPQTFAPPPPLGAIPPAPPIPPAAPKAPPAPSSGLGSGLSAFIEEVVDRVTSVIGDFSGPRYEFPTEITGLFTADEVPLRIFTGNGHIELKAWDQSGYKAQIVVKARGSTEAEARNRASEAYLVKATESGFELESNRRYDWSDLSVHCTLYLPREKAYRLEARSGNGHIRVEEVTLIDGTANSGNGRITLRGLSADRLSVRSGNGSVEIDGDILQLEAGTGNGSMKVIPMGRRSESYQLKTGNGSITIDTGRLSRETGLYLDTHTGMGSINLGRTDLIFERDERNVGNKRVVARNQAYDSADCRVAIRASTGLGSISVE